MTTITITEEKSVTESGRVLATDAKSQTSSAPQGYTSIPILKGWEMWSLQKIEMPKDKAKKKKRETKIGF